MPVLQRWEDTDSDSSHGSAVPLKTALNRYDDSSSSSGFLVRHLSTHHLRTRLAFVWTGLLRSGDTSADSSLDDSDDEEASGAQDESSDEVPKGLGIISLTSTHLESLHAISSLEDAHISAYAQEGLSLNRMKLALKNGVCECGCRLPLRDLAQVCKVFWKLPKSSQDTVLWGLQSCAAGRKNNWEIEGEVFDGF